MRMQYRKNCAFEKRIQLNFWLQANRLLEQLSRGHHGFARKSHTHLSIYFAHFPRYRDSESSRVVFKQSNGKRNPAVRINGVGQHIRQVSTSIRRADSYVPHCGRFLLRRSKGCLSYCHKHPYLLNRRRRACVLHSRETDPRCTAPAHLHLAGNAQPRRLARA